ncbi:hypothetical protein D3C73_1404160 [compost metagenome]
MHFLGAWGFQVNDPADTRVHSGNIQGAAGLQRNLIARVTQLREQRNGIGLGQRLAAGDADIARLEACDLLEDRIKGADSAAAEGVFAVAILAAQRAAGETDKNRGQASGTRFTLQRVKNFGNS